MVQAVIVGKNESILEVLVKVRKNVPIEEDVASRGVKNVKKQTFDLATALVFNNLNVKKGMDMYLNLIIGDNGTDNN